MHSITPAIARMRWLAKVLLAGILLSGCDASLEGGLPVMIGLHPNETPELRTMIGEVARAHGVPADLVQRVVARESARTMGYRGPPQGLLDARTNLTFGVRYLRGAWMVSEGDRDAAERWYALGYYYEARRSGLLEETGLR